MTQSSSRTMRLLFPFSAIVGQEAMKAALLLNAVDPSLGGVLIRGQKGTGKSTAVRALAPLLPEIEAIKDCPYNSEPSEPAGFSVSGRESSSPARPIEIVRKRMPFVELPLNATEDRLAGTLHLEKVLQTGERQFEPGLLAAANRGVLYVDEVNLLDDHLVDMLLDAAASGVNLVEREGISISHPSRFALIGTMNPEEGELRPQLLDRFGLCASVDPLANETDRERVIRNHLDFQADGNRFLAEWKESQLLIADQIQWARLHLAEVAVPDRVISATARLTAALQIPGHRAEISIVKAARAHAALLETQTVTDEDLRTAAHLVLFHRLPASPLDTPEALRDKIDKALARITVPGLPNDRETGREADVPLIDDFDEAAENMQIPGAHAAGSILFSFLKKKSLKKSFQPTNASAR